MTSHPRNSPERLSAERSGLHRNVWVAGGTSFLTDVSSEMLQNVLPLFLANVLGVRVWAVGLVEGLAESTASLLKLYSGLLSDRLQTRKWLAVAGYAISSCAKPFYILASSWGVVAAIRWVDRVGKGVRTAPRDALLADSVRRERRGLAFGIHRASDTAGAVVGLLCAILVVRATQGGDLLLESSTFHTLVLWSLGPAFLAVLILALGARDVRVAAGEGGGGSSPRPKIKLLGMDRTFVGFVVCSAIFALGNSSDAFLILRAQDLGLGVLPVLWTLLAFNVVYTVVSAPAGALADKLPRKWVVLGAWAVYAAVYLGFAVSTTRLHIVLLFLGYGLYYGAVSGAARALVSDLVEPERRGVAYGTYHAVIGFANLPASLLAGFLWQGVGRWHGFGASAPFYFGAACAGLAGTLLIVLVKRPPHGPREY